jgi:ubiquinone/menaquinone biosynthesis C-methylase UbiE
MTTVAAPTGNTFDKYSSRNPFVRLLMARFHGALTELFAAAAPSTVLDVGCGEGVLTELWAAQLGSGRVVGVDLDDPRLAREWSARQRDNLEFRALDGHSLPFADDEFDLVAAIEVLEHVGDPAQTLAEMMRVARSHLLVSVPREPLWRILNMTRCAYLGALGNTPGHLHHFSRAAFERLLKGYGEVVDARSPLPWSMLLVRV